MRDITSCLNFKLRTMTKCSHTPLFFQLPGAMSQKPLLYAHTSITAISPASLEAIAIMKGLQDAFGMMQNVRWSSSVLMWWIVCLCPACNESY
jgi:hypothetical protein